MISVEDGSFGFAADIPPVIKNIQLRIKPSTFTMVIGPVGSGKSTLLKAFLGEMPSISGVVYTAEREIGYCSQDPWLPNVTIRQSVVGACEFDIHWYNRILHACALDVDVHQFPYGDDTIIGSKGIILSGGQKQRLALARAVYARKRILLLDDVLSGLDKKTEQMVFHRVLGPEGLCHEHGITVVLATHAIKYLRYAEHIIVLDKSGTIAERGSFEDLESHNTFEADTLGYNAGKDDQSSPSQREAALSLRNAAMQSEKAKKARIAGDIRLYAYYAKAVGWMLAFYFCAHTATIFFIKFPDVWLRWWSAAEVSHPGRHTGFYLGIYCMFGGLSLCGMIIAILAIFTGVLPRSSARLHRRLLDTVMSAPYSFLSATDLGIILNRYVSLLTGFTPSLTNSPADLAKTCL